MRATQPATLLSVSCNGLLIPKNGLSQAPPDDLSIRNDGIRNDGHPACNLRLLFLASIPEELRHHGLAEGHRLWMNDSGDS